MNNLSNNLKYLRNRYGYKQKDVANGIGVSAQTYSKYESNKRSLNFDLLDKFSKFYKVPILLFLYPLESVIAKFDKNEKSNLSELFFLFEFIFYDSVKIDENLDILYKEQFEKTNGNNIEFTKTNEIISLSSQLAETLTKSKNIKSRIDMLLQAKIDTISKTLYKKRI